MILLTAAAHLQALSLPEAAIRLSIAMGLCTVIGIEREWRERAAGMRTHLLVGLGAAMFAIISGWGYHDLPLVTGASLDPTRIAAQVVSGIGFLGAGAIIRNGLSVRGLTTSASLWVVAAIGLGCGAGLYSASALATAFVMVGLGPMRRVEGWIARGRQGHVIFEFTLAKKREIGEVLGECQALGMIVDQFKISEHDGEHGRHVQIDCRLEADKQAIDVASKLAMLKGVGSMEWKSAD